jgi:hypothetical protein
VHCIEMGQRFVTSPSPLPLSRRARGPCTERNYCGRLSPQKRPSQRLGLFAYLFEFYPGHLLAGEVQQTIGLVKSDISREGRARILAAKLGE